VSEQVWGAVAAAVEAGNMETAYQVLIEGIAQIVRWIIQLIQDVLKIV